MVAYRRENGGVSYHVLSTVVLTDAVIVSSISCWLKGTTLAMATVSTAAYSFRCPHSREIGAPDSLGTVKRSEHIVRVIDVSGFISKLHSLYSRSKTHAKIFRRARVNPALFDCPSHRFATHAKALAFLSTDRGLGSNP